MKIKHLYKRSVRERIRGAKYFTRLDMRDGYHHLRIKKGHEKRTAFLTEYGLYEWTVMCFGLKNAPAQFARYMNDNLKEFLKEFVVIYFDDIMIYSNDLESHRERISDQQRYQVKHGYVQRRRQRNQTDNQRSHEAN